MSKEARSEQTEPFSDKIGEESEAANVNTEDSDNLHAWDNYREDPSFVEKDPEEEVAPKPISRKLSCS